MASQFRGNVKINERELPFQIKTSDVKSYLQDSLDVLAENLGTKAFPIEVISDNQAFGSKFFAPFVLVLPQEALKDDGDMRSNKGNGNPSDGLSIIKLTHLNEPKSNTGLLKDYVYKLFNAYAYPRGDDKYYNRGIDLRNESFRHQLGISREMGIELSKIQSPKYYKNEKVTLWLLDPIAIFHDMLMANGDPRPFIINIKSFKPLNRGEILYNVERIVTNGNKKFKGKDRVSTIKSLISNR